MDVEGRGSAVVWRPQEGPWGTRVWEHNRHTTVMTWGVEGRGSTVVGRPQQGPWGTSVWEYKRHTTVMTTVAVT